MAEHMEHARRQPTIDEHIGEAFPPLPTIMHRRVDNVRQHLLAIVSSWYGSMAILKIAHIGVGKSAHAYTRLPRSAERGLLRHTGRLLRYDASSYMR